jgi:hypothetical protein
VQEEVNLKLYLQHLEFVVCAMTHIYSTIFQGGCAVVLVLALAGAGTVVLSPESCVEALRLCSRVGFGESFQNESVATAYAGLENNTVSSP